MKNLFCLLCCGIFFAGCSKNTSNRCRYTAAPPSFGFIVKNNGNIFPDDFLKGVKLSYDQSGDTYYVKDIEPAVDVYAQHGILVTRNAGVFSAKRNIKVYYLAYPGDSLLPDTLFLDYETYKPSNDCQYTLREVKFNHQIILPDTLKGFPKAYPVYVFNKRK